MRYRLRPGRPLDSEFRNLYRSLNETLALALLMACREPERGVHQARRSCKEVRALLRLFGGDASHQRFYRSLAAGLSGQRDAVVMVKTWQGLVNEIADFQGSEFVPVTRFLSTPEGVAEARPGDQSMYLELAQSAEAQCARGPGCGIPNGLSALERIYRRARKAWHKASDSGDREDFHDFRKRSKELYYSLRFLKPLLPKPSQRLVGQLKKLTEVQGLANDVAVLEEHLSAHADQIRLTQVGWRCLNRVLANKEQALQAKAFRLAKPILAVRPCQFTGRLNLPV
ncbi:CHAD domain-containing protein [Marinobacter mobilis]|uniref:CHAD domain-containing protein n=1 Tax=Marinobacter mobilis TaxID=488533 RepID=A0A1H2SWZ1_9GAMM|nr:CHAD domain-containing protein [Marinobacter mobilis]SDW36122.1 CHAD domain-containing protein [Marinobacter mobilis]